MGLTQQAGCTESQVCEQAMCFLPNLCLMEACWVLSSVAQSLPLLLQDVWIHVVTFVLCATTVACGGYRLHGEYNNNVAQTLSILVRAARLHSLHDGCYRKAFCPWAPTQLGHLVPPATPQQTGMGPPHRQYSQHALNMMHGLLLKHMRGAAPLLQCSAMAMRLLLRGSGF